jgi:phosphoribosyl-ATP pyrophosphohydrolase
LAKKIKLSRITDSVPAEDRFDRLATAVAEVRQGARQSPRTLKLITSGPAKMAQKVVEEAAEVAIEAAMGNREALIHESVDLIYNLSVLWSALGVEPQVVWAEMDRREATLGMAEKLPKTGDDD